MQCVVGLYIFTLHMMFKTIIMTFKLTWQNRRWS